MGFFLLVQKVLNLFAGFLYFVFANTIPGEDVNRGVSLVPDDDGDVVLGGIHPIFMTSLGDVTVFFFIRCSDESEVWENGINLVHAVFFEVLNDIFAVADFLIEV